MKPSFIETLKYIPLDRVFIESDSDRNVSLKERYHIFSEIRQKGTQEIALKMLKNAKIFFTWKNISFPPGWSGQNS